MFDKLVLISLGVWAGLTGLFTVTNIGVEYGHTICGFAALIVGVICIVRACR
jgi:hypothetical protein